MTIEAILGECTVEGNVVKLPPRQLPREEYMKVKKSLEGIGGKWTGGKVFGFVFKSDPTELLSLLVGGEKVNLKREYQFFPTPPDLADTLVQLAEVDPRHCVLEPSAGRGAIVEAIHRRHSKMKVDCFELMPDNQTHLESIPYARLMGDDFLAANRKYDRIIANPPFTKNQDIKHITHMYECLNADGVMVSIASAHWVLSQNKKEVAFKNWLAKVNAQVQDVPPGAFKASGTSIETRIIIIRKRNNG